MSDEIFFDGIRHISANDAAASSGFTRDYIARLCRDGKVRGRRIGKNWYVDHNSFQSFLVGQEYAKSRRNESLVQERRREYHDTNDTNKSRNQQMATNNTNPIRSHSQIRTSPFVSDSQPLVDSNGPIRIRTSDIKNTLASAVAMQTSYAAAHAKQFLAAPGGFSHAALHGLPAHAAAYVPVHTLTPVMEFAHKVMALTLAFMLTFGTYAAVDPQYARFAADSMREQLDATVDSYYRATDGGMVALADRAQTQVASAAEDPGGTLTMLARTVPTTAAHLASSLNTRLNSLVYSIAFPFERIRSKAFAGFSGPDPGSVAVQVVAYSPKSPQKPAGSSIAKAGIASGSTLPTGYERVIERVVIERVQGQALAQAGGITEEILNKRINDLDNKLSSRMVGAAVANSTNVTNVYNTIAAAGRFDHLKDLDLDQRNFHQRLRLGPVLHRCS